MKTKISILLIAMLSIMSCEEDLVVYDAENGQTLASFSTTSVRLGTPVEGSSAEVQVNVSTAAATDRSIVLEVDPSSTATADQYSISNLGIPAGSFVGTITVSGIFETLPEEGARLLVLKLTDVSGSNDIALENATLSVSLFRQCPSEPTPGIWTVIMEDGYEDGWQTTTDSGGPGLTCTLSTGEVFEFGLCTPYEEPSYDCTPEFAAGTATFTMPEGVESAEWFFPGDFWGEISFSIVAPNGNVVAAYGPGSEAGPVTIDFCAQ